MNPECKQGKHSNCDGTAWDEEQDCRTKCQCRCHWELTN